MPPKGYPLRLRMPPLEQSIAPLRIAMKKRAQRMSRSIKRIPLTSRMMAARMLQRPIVHLQRSMMRRREQRAMLLR